jgi:hypothetical protein
MAKKKDESPPLMALDVKYGNVNIGMDTCRLGITVERAKLTITQADRNLCGKRLVGTILARAGDAQSSQDSLPGIDADVTLSAAFDVKSFGVTRKNISAGLTFAIASVNVETLSHFAGRQGTFTVTNINDIPEGEPTTDEE